MHRRCRVFACFCLLLVLLVMGSSCARQSPNRNPLSGKRLRVTVNFLASPLDDATCSYFFLINNAGDENAPGPVPVIDPLPGSVYYGNGFATGPAGQIGFTDFVVFTGEQPQSYSLRHVLGRPENNQFTNPVRPVAFTPPRPGDPRTAKQLQFEIDMAQLIFDASGRPLEDQAEAVNRARSIQHLQVNFVATNLVPVGATTPQDKWVDAFGDTTDSNANGSWLVINMAETGRIYSSRDTLSQQLGPEPSFSDVVPRSYEPIDIQSWTIEIIDTGR